MFFEKKVDTRSREKMVAFLSEHFRYNTMNSWNGSSSFANKVKIYDLGLSSEQIDAAFELMSADDNYWEQLSDSIDNFTAEMNGYYTIGSNGRSSGYLVLYNSQYESTGHKSRCRSCGQHSFKYGLVPTSDNEGAIMAEVLRNGGVWTTAQYLEHEAVKAIPLFDEEKAMAISKAKAVAKETTLGNKCGRCGAEGEKGRVNYDKIPRKLVTTGQGIDQNADYADEDEWSMSALRDRVKLVQAFDRACDRIREDFICMLGDYEVVEETIMVPQTRKVIVQRLEA